MSPLVLIAVLSSAVMHGSWNAIAKSIPDRLAASSLIGLVYLVVGSIGCLLLPVPAAAAWSALIASVLLQTAYLILLTAAYTHSDFSVAYPLTRGLAVLGVTVIAITVLGEQLNSLQLAGVAIVIGALFTLAIAQGRHRSRVGLALILAVGACVTAYSVIDGVGVRVSGSALGYASWLFLLQGITLPVSCLLLSRDRGQHLAALRRHAPIGAVGGTLSLLAYGIVVWAQSVAPLALVSALRETGVVAAGVIGMLLFKERPGRAGIAAAIVAAIGIAIIRLGSE